VTMMSASELIDKPEVKRAIDKRRICFATRCRTAALRSGKLRFWPSQTRHVARSW
jgi:hypothetical protein